MEFGESLRECAERECLEETGLIVRAEDTGFYAFSMPVSIELQYVIVDVKCEYESGDVRAGDDAVKALWADRALFDSLPIGQDTINLIKSSGIYEKLC